MATIKSFTNPSQSKVLAEILPLESADAFYVIGKEPVDIVVVYGFVTHKHLKEQIAYKRAVPCWSLSALLDVLPSATLDSSDDHHYRVHCNGRFTDWHDNPIDCCVAMINRLHEQMIYDFNNI